MISVLTAPGIATTLLMPEVGSRDVQRRIQFTREEAIKRYGEKLARDLGFVSTMDNPKTDFGEPYLGSGWDIDQK